MVKKHYIEFGGVYDVPFIVYIDKEKGSDLKIVKVYKTSAKRLDFNLSKLASWRKQITPFYDVLVAKYKPIKVFTPRGNILLQLSKYRYVFIGKNIIEFTIDDDIIMQFYAPVPGSYPFPYGFGKKFVYFMIEGSPINKIPIEYFKDLNKKEKETNAFSYYYGHQGNEPLQKYSKKLKSQKIVVKG
jgi:hypothetical protein